MEIADLQPGDRVRRTNLDAAYLRRNAQGEFGTFLRSGGTWTYPDSYEQPGRWNSRYYAYVHFDGNKNPCYIFPDFLEPAAFKPGEGRMILTTDAFVEIDEVPIKANGSRLTIDLPSILTKRLGLEENMMMSVQLTHESKQFVFIALSEPKAEPKAGE